MRFLFAVYDTTDNHLCLGVFKSVIEVSKYFNIVPDYVYKSINYKRIIYKKYIVEKIKIN